MPMKEADQVLPDQTAATVGRKTPDGCHDATTKLARGMQRPMRRITVLTVLAVAAIMGRDANAKAPDDAAPPEQGRFFGRFRKTDPGPKPMALPEAKPEVPPPTIGGQPAPNPPRTPTAGTIRQAADAPVRRVQAGPGDVGGVPPLPAAELPANPGALEPGQNLTLEAALYGAITNNPDLISLRQGNVPGNAASPEAVEVARRFPTVLNPTLWVDVRPLVYERVPGGTTPSGRPFGASLDQKDALMYFSLRQPVELGNQTRYRHAIAVSALTQQRWTVVQAELLALVQTYRFFQTAAYRREKLRVARDLAGFSDKLVETLRRRLEAGQVTADVVILAEVESEATSQLAKAAKQEYARALTDLRNQLGAPGTVSAEPLGEFVLPTYIPPVEDRRLIETALQNRPEIHAARAQIEGARAAINLAKGDRIPTPVVGPVYERDEQGSQFFGFVYITPLPIVNNGKPLVRQREAEYRRAGVALEQLQQRTAAQVTAALANWNEANELTTETTGLTAKLRGHVESLERLFEAGQTNIATLLQARQRLIQLENAELDAIWQSTQAQADLLTALGAPNLMAALQDQETAASQPSSLAPPAPATGAPSRR